MLECMKNRRSIRKYTDQDIPESLLNELLEVATRASNTGNMQLYSVVVTRDPANKEKLAPAHFNQPMITGAPVVLTFCADANRFVKWAECRKAEAGFDNLQTFIASTIDAMLFAQSFCNAAEEKGLGICYLGTTAYNADRSLRRFLFPVWLSRSLRLRWVIRQSLYPLKLNVYHWRLWYKTRLIRTLLRLPSMPCIVRKRH